MFKPDPTFFEIRIRIRKLWYRPFCYIDLPRFQEGPGGGGHKKKQTNIMKIYLGHRLETEDKQTWLWGVNKELYIF